MCVHVSYPAIKVINILERLNNVEDSSSGSGGDKLVRGPLVFGPALLFSPDIAASFSKSKVLQASDSGIPLTKLHSSGIFSSHVENIHPDPSVL